MSTFEGAIRVYKRFTYGGFLLMRRGLRVVGDDALHNEQFMSLFLSEQLDLRAGQRVIGRKNVDHRRNEVPCSGE